MPIPQGRHDLSVSGCRRCRIIQWGNLISRIVAILTHVTTFDKGQFDMIAEALSRLALMLLQVPAVPSLIQTVSIVRPLRQVMSFVTLPTVGMETYDREYILSGTRDQKRNDINEDQDGVQNL